MVVGEGVALMETDVTVNVLTEVNVVARVEVTTRVVVVLLVNVVVRVTNEVTGV